MTMKKWIQVNEIGELYKECVLVRFDVPLLFVCKDKRNNRYLVLCIDEEEGVYLCQQVTVKVLLKMLNKEITMADTFRQTPIRDNFLISYNFESESFEGHYILTEDLTADMLPDEGVYFQLDNQNVRQYILKLKEENDNVCMKISPRYIEDIEEISRQVIAYKKIQRSSAKRLFGAYDRKNYEKMRMLNYDAELCKVSQKRQRKRMYIGNLYSYRNEAIEQMYRENIYKIEGRGVGRCLVRR